MRLFRLIVVAAALGLPVNSQTAPTGQIGLMASPGVVEGAPATLAKPDQVTQAWASETYGKLPLSFEVNQGQTDSQIKFFSRGKGYTLFLTSTEVVLTLRKPEQKAKGKGQRAKGKREEQEKTDLTKLATRNSQLETVVRMKFVGANPTPQVTGSEELLGKSNYLIGNNPKNWHTSTPTYARVQYRDIYPGIDLIYYGNQRRLEYDFIVAPGVNPKAIKLAFEGIDKLEVNARGDLVLHIAGGHIRLHKPFIYQEVDSVKQEISGGYVLKGKREVGFQVATYDAGRPLIIDPVLSYSTYLGGSDDDRGFGIAVDAEGNAYLAGLTTSVDFPTANPSQAVNSGDGDVFVAKLDPTGSTLVYSTYLGGSDSDTGLAIAVDAEGNAYLTGQTSSVDFPTANPSQAVNSGDGDAFVAKLDPTGSTLVYSTYLGGSTSDSGRGIAVDAEGNAYVTGITNSTDFPIANPLQADFGGGFDAFVAKLDPTGSTLAYSTYLGGDDEESGRGIAVDAEGNAYVTGSTDSTDFPTASPSQADFGGDFDAFVAKLDPTGSTLAYSTYLGGDDEESGRGIAVDAEGNAYVTGSTDSTDFPTASPSQAVSGGGRDAFVAKLNTTGSALIYSTYLGGSSSDTGFGIAVDAEGNAYVTGQTGSTNFPTKSSFQATNANSFSAFVAKLDTTGSALIYSTYLGGSSSDTGFGIAVDAEGNAYVTGEAFSTDFPTVNPLQAVNGGGSDADANDDAFIAKIADTPGLMAVFEGPEPGFVSGIGVIRGWAFATEADNEFASIELSIDGERVGDIPCCSERADVQAAFLEFPEEKTLNSGWGTTFNWGLLDAGTPTVRVDIRGVVGELLFTEPRTVTVIKPGDFEFLDMFDLSGAEASIKGGDLFVEGVVVRDKTTQQQKEINARFRWFGSSQSMGMVGAETIEEISSLSSSLFAWLSSLFARLGRLPAPARAGAAQGITAFFESPEEGQAVFGITVIRGWAFAEEAERSITSVRLLIDGEPGTTVPCCSERGDVQASFPESPGALRSGWGLTFNYGLLTSGPHTIGVEIEDSTGASLALSHSVTVVKAGVSEFLDQFDLSEASARIEGEEIVLEGVELRDKLTQQIGEFDLRLRWFENSQALGIVQAVGTIGSDDG